MQAEQRGRTYVTSVKLDDVRVHDLRIGAVRPAGSRVRKVRLDGRTVKRPTVQQTNRGVEVTVPAHGRGHDRHTVSITLR